MLYKNNNKNVLINVTYAISEHNEKAGLENKDNAVSVTYNQDCEFVVATLNKQLGSVTNITTGSISDVKKQSNVYLYGEFSDTLHFNATKVVIARWE